MQIQNIKVLEDYVYSSQLKNTKSKLHFIKNESVFILDINYLYLFVEREYDRGIYLLKKVQQELSDIQIVYIFNSNFLYQFLNLLKIETPTDLNIVKFISFVKKQLFIKDKIETLLNNTKINYFMQNDFLFNDKKDIIKLMMFTKIQINFNKLIKSPQVQHCLIKNWEYFFNQLSKTTLYSYLK